MNAAFLLSLLCTSAVLIWETVGAADQAAFVIEDEFRSVSCASVVKLAHLSSSCRLHSLSINYGSGSGQQAITCLPAADSTDSYFAVHAAHNEPICKRGAPFPCNSIIRLQHLNTKKYLHSHAGHASPLSNNQEVSAFDGGDKGDDWILVCLNKSDKFWSRESPIRLQHDETKKYLTASKAVYNRVNPPGQTEVSGVTNAGINELWAAQEGLYFEYAD